MKISDSKSDNTATEFTVEDQHLSKCS